MPSGPGTSLRLVPAGTRRMRSGSTGTRSPSTRNSPEQIGTGQMSESHRLSISYEDPRRAGPATAVLKLASSDSTSRATGVGLGIYAREVRFYTELAPRIGGPLASCSFAQYDPGEG